MRTVPVSATSLSFASETMTRMAASLPARYSVWPMMWTTGRRRICEMDSMPSIAGSVVVVVLEAIAHALPDDVVEGDGLVRGDDLLPRAVAFADVDVAFDPAEDVVFGVEYLGDEPAEPSRGSDTGS